eukprot:1523417-Alexandrium_andersonii.AAC.1
MFGTFEWERVDGELVEGVPREDAVPQLVQLYSDLKEVMQFDGFPEGWQSRVAQLELGSLALSYVEERLPQRERSCDANAVRGPDSQEPFYVDTVGTNCWD